ncbi:hypothetical protein T484DRAFT_1790716 [Baffinella frigidus]|nr:hypothetical protein T484DRAFT_1790716 [Cryptophyta sp. CCMP2293]
MCRALVSALALTLLLATTSDGASSVGCRDLGFTETLVCSKCSRLEEMVKDEQLAKECRGCCSEDVDDAAASVKAASAVLEVCT